MALAVGAKVAVGSTDGLSVGCAVGVLLALDVQVGVGRLVDTGVDVGATVSSAPGWEVASGVVRGVLAAPCGCVSSGCGVIVASAATDGATVRLGADVLVGTGVSVSSVTSSVTSSAI